MGDCRFAILRINRIGVTTGADWIREMKMENRLTIAADVSARRRAQ
jgi:hypothetical protein